MTAANKESGTNVHEVVDVNLWRQPYQHEHHHNRFAIFAYSTAETGAVNEREVAYVFAWWSTMP